MHKVEVNKWFCRKFCLPAIVSPYLAEETQDFSFAFENVNNPSRRKATDANDQSARTTRPTPKSAKKKVPCTATVSTKARSVLASEDENA
jgi:hypothetical protein